MIKIALAALGIVLFMDVIAAADFGIVSWRLLCIQIRQK